MIGVITTIASLFSVEKERNEIRMEKINHKLQELEKLMDKIWAAQAASYEVSHHILFETFWLNYILEKTSLLSNYHFQDLIAIKNLREQIEQLEQQGRKGQGTSNQGIGYSNKWKWDWVRMELGNAEWEWSWETQSENGVRETQSDNGVGKRREGMKPNNPVIQYTLLTGFK